MIIPFKLMSTKVRPKLVYRQYFDICCNLHYARSVNFTQYICCHEKNLSCEYVYIRRFVRERIDQPIDVNNF